MTDTGQDGERVTKVKRKAIWVCDFNVDGKKKALQTVMCHVDADTMQENLEVLGHVKINKEERENTNLG